MSYLKLIRARLILVCFSVSSLLLVLFPSIDISISRLFFDNGFYLEGPRWKALFQDGVLYFLCLSMLSVFGVYVFNRVSKRNLCGLDGRKLLYLIVVLILGAGLIVNATLKDHFGRARPRDIEEFGGSKHFTPPFVISHECARNCSFSSGDAAGAFFSLALALALSRKRAIWLGGLAFGSVVSLYRIAAGAHFFSDCVVSFFVMLIIADALYYYMILHKSD
jgi:lipid A 4'-phosphatase